MEKFDDSLKEMFNKLIEKNTNLQYLYVLDYEKDYDKNKSKWSEELLTKIKKTMKEKNQKNIFNYYQFKF